MQGDTLYSYTLPGETRYTYTLPGVGQVTTYESIEFCLSLCAFDGKLLALHRSNSGNTGLMALRGL